LRKIVAMFVDDWRTSAALLVWIALVALARGHVATAALCVALFVGPALALVLSVRGAARR
jgi:hypothetical protein